MSRLNEPTSGEVKLAGSAFSRRIAHGRQSGRLVVQPRLGFTSAAKMGAALQQVKASGTNVVGTITIDSFTRIGDYVSAARSLKRGEDLNGYPIISQPVEVTREMIAGLADEGFPLQMRHGTPRPLDVFQRMAAVGLDATEGGPVSYSLPYGRVPLTETVAAWWDACRFLADEVASPHIESFGGCMLGQLCPPSLLVALSVLEGLFFKSAGIASVSLSYAQGPSRLQDMAALAVMRDLSDRWLGAIDCHQVLYTYMGVFPGSLAGARRLIEDSAALAAAAGCERLIVKTAAERRQIPTVEENVEALQWAQASADAVTRAPQLSSGLDALIEEIGEEADALIEGVLDLDPDIGSALIEAFRRGVLDVPYCLHPDNLGRTRAVIDERGLLQWAETGNLPLAAPSRQRARERIVTADAFLEQLHHVACAYDFAAGIGT